MNLVNFRLIDPCHDIWIQPKRYDCVTVFSTRQQALAGEQLLHTLHFSSDIAIHWITPSGPKIASTIARALCRDIGLTL